MSDDYRICGCCGDRFPVLRPDMWTYKRDGKYFCSWSCYREKEAKTEMGRKITLEQKKKAVEIAIGGGDPLAYLKQCGSESPDKLWWYIKSKLKDADPDLYAKIPDGRKRGKPEAVPKPPTDRPQPRPGSTEPKTLDGSAWEPFTPEKPAKKATVEKAAAVPETPAAKEQAGLKTAERMKELKDKPITVTGVAPVPKPVENLEIPVKINLNDRVKVKLTVEGIKNYIDYMNEPNRGVPADSQAIPPRDCLPKIDGEGYTRMQLWEMFQIFGRHINIAVNAPIYPLEIIRDE